MKQVDFQREDETEDEYVKRVAQGLRLRYGIRTARQVELQHSAPCFSELAVLGADDRRLVYFAECMTDGGPIKIGLASDVGRRLGEVQVGCPYPIELMGTVPGGREGERLFHRLFSAFRIHGEWFWPDRIVTRTIRTLLQEQKHSRKAGAA